MAHRKESLVTARFFLPLEMEKLGRMSLMTLMVLVTMATITGNIEVCRVRLYSSGMYMIKMVCQPVCLPIFTI